MKSIVSTLFAIATALLLSNPVQAGYANGMNHYAAYHVMHGGVDPSGLEIVILVDITRQDDETKGDYETYSEMLEGEIMTGWNKAVNNLINVVDKNENIIEYELNGEKFDKQKTLEILRDHLMVVRVMDGGIKAGNAMLLQAAADAGEYGEVVIESHTTSDFLPNADGDLVNTALMRIGGEWVPYTDVAKLISGKIKSELVLGSCFWSEEEIQEVSNALNVPVHASPGDQHQSSPNLKPRGNVITIEGMSRGHSLKVKPKDIGEEGSDSE